MENTIKKIKKINGILDYLIIGNSAAGLSAASAIRTIDKTSSILVLTNEQYKNYSKPLITYLLAGKIGLDNIYFKDEKFYEENNILLELGINIKKINFEVKKVISDRGISFKYNKLLFANGGTPIIPQIKIVGVDDFLENFRNKNINVKVEEEIITQEMLDSTNYKNNSGIFTFTCLKDALQIQKYIIENKIKEAVILGGGLIGLKSAEALLEIGVKVSIVELSDRLLSTTFDKYASSIIENEIKNNRSKIYTSNTISKIFIKNNTLAGIELKNKEKINTKLLIIAVGVVPDLKILKESDMKNEQIKFERGIFTNEYMQTSIKDVYAAGDVAESFDFITGNKANIAIWPLAVRQGEIAGINMAGGNKTYNGGYFMNSIEILGIPSISIGLTNPVDNNGGNIGIIKDFKPEGKFYKKVVISDGKIIGVILVGNIDRAGIYGGLIKNKVDVSSIKENLIKENLGIIQLPSDYKKHLVVGDGIEV